MSSSRPYTFDRVIRIFFNVIIFCIVLYFLYLLHHVLLPFCVACLVAYLIEPWVKWNQRTLHLRNHTWAVVLTVLETALLCALMCIIIIPIVEREISQFSQLLNHYVNNGHYSISKVQTNIYHFIHAHFDMDKIIEQIEKLNVSQAIEWIWSSLTSGLNKILGILGWLISFVYVIFILLDFEKYKRLLETYIPNRYKSPVQSVLHDTSWTMKKYFRNQALISVVVGICYAIGFSIVGIPMAVVIGLINIILFMIPYMVYISLIPVTVMCVFHAMQTGIDFWAIWFECLAVYAIVEIFSDLILTPRVMGKALGLNPAVILLSLSVWGTLLGLLGMLIALPATTILIKWTKIWLTGWRDKLNSADNSSD